MPKTPKKRELCAVGLLVFAGGALWYGALFHKVQIFEQQEREIAIPVPTPFGSADAPPEEPSGGAAADEDDPFSSPPSKPAQPTAKPAQNPPALLPSDATFKKVTEKYWAAREETEWVISRDVTFGGLTRLADGQVRRTYSGKPPTMCPT